MCDSVLFHSLLLCPVFLFCSPHAASLLEGTQQEPNYWELRSDPPCWAWPPKIFRSSSHRSTPTESSLRDRSHLNPSCKLISFLPRELETSSQNVSCWAKARFYTIFDIHNFLRKAKIGEFFFYCVTLQKLFHQPLGFLQLSGPS